MAVIGTNAVNVAMTIVSVGVQGVLIFLLFHFI